jgi:hypothetical protein
MTNDESNSGHSQQGALEAMLEARLEQGIVSDYRTIASVFADDDYKAIVDLAWRHQFNEERLNFKRDIRELQQDVGRRAVERLERSK